MVSWDTPLLSSTLLGISPSPSTSMWKLEGWAGLYAWGSEPPHTHTAAVIPIEARKEGEVAELVRWCVMYDA